MVEALFCNDRDSFSDSEDDIPLSCYRDLNLQVETKGRCRVTVEKWLKDIISAEAEDNENQFGCILYVDTDGDEDFHHPQNDRNPRCLF